MSGDDAIEFMLAGATAVQVGTLNFLRPDAGRFVLQGVVDHMKRRGQTSIAQLAAAGAPA